MKLSKPTPKFLISIQNSDLKLIQRMFDSPQYERYLPWAKRISFIGDGWLYVLIGLVSYLVNGADHLYFWMLLLAFTFERPSYYIIKNTLKRQRPYRQLNRTAYLVPSDEFSLPSGHTSAAFLFAVISGLFLPNFMALLLIIATLIGLSRIILGVHFLTDICLGAVMGVSYALISLQLIQNFSAL